MRLAPGTAKPGQRFTATFPTKGEHGGNLLMKPDACGHSDIVSNDIAPPHWFEVPEHSRYSTSELVYDRRSIRAVVPPVAPPGRYRVCTQDENFCADLIVSD